MSLCDTEKAQELVWHDKTLYQLLSWKNKTWLLVSATTYLCTHACMHLSVHPNQMAPLSGSTVCRNQNAGKGRIRYKWR